MVGGSAEVVSGCDEATPTRGAWSTAMDEVKAMTHAGETAGGAVGTGLRTWRRGAVQVGQAGMEAVRDATADTQAEVVKTTRKARKQLVKDARKVAKSTGKDLTKSAKRARKHAG